MKFYKRLLKSLTTVTAFSKIIALFIFIMFFLAFFYAGFSLGKLQSDKIVTEVTPVPMPTVTATPSPTCIPRPKCLDTVPRCMIAETPNMCPPKSK